jgi:HupE / UreJ protein
MRKLLLSLTIALFPVLAFGHALSGSYLTLDADARARHLDGRWEIRIADLNDVLNLDGDGDGAVTWADLDREAPRTFEYVMSHLTVQQGQANCTLTRSRQLLDERSDGYYLVLEFAGRCPAGVGPLAVESRLFFDRDASHRVLLKVALGSTIRSTLLSPLEPRWQAPREASAIQTLGAFIKEGIRHIWIGYDHIAFLILLLLPAVLVSRTDGQGEGDGSWQPAARWTGVAGTVLRIVTAFTIAHSITLSLAALGFVVPPERPVEIGIAGSVIVAGIVNLYPRVARRGTLLAFTFGLLHGFGFANVLRELHLASTSLAWPLAGFNLGVEIGQVTIVLLVLPIIYAARQSPLYLRRIVPATSIMIAVLAGAWLMQRLS